MKEYTVIFILFYFPTWQMLQNGSLTPFCLLDFYIQVIYVSIID